MIIQPETNRYAVANKSALAGSHSRLALESAIADNRQVFNPVYPDTIRFQGLIPWTELPRAPANAQVMMQDILAQYQFDPLEAPNEIMLKAKRKLRVGDHANPDQRHRLSQVLLSVLNRINPFPDRQIPNSERLFIKPEGNSLLWGQAMAIGMACSLEKLKCGKITTIEDLQDYLARFHQAAMICILEEQGEIKRFGNRYHCQQKVFPVYKSRDQDAWHRNWRLVGAHQTTDQYGETCYRFATSDPSDLYRTFCQKAVLNGRTVTLGFLKSGEYNSVPTLQKEVNPFINKVLLPSILAKPGCGNQETLKQIAMIHGLASFSCQFERGSSGVDNAISYVLADYAGIRLGRKQAGIAPDLQAITRPLDHKAAIETQAPANILPFIQYYPTMFIEPPQYPNRLLSVVKPFYLETRKLLSRRNILGMKNDTVLDKTTGSKG